VDGIKRVAQRIHDSRAAGRRVVAVISAMGDITDELLELAAKVSPSPAARDLDFSAHHRRASIALLVWLWRTSVSRRSCSPGTVRVETDDVHGKAHIVDVDPRRLPTVLARGEIPLVAGFQGKKLKSKETTTPGRRGSDLTGNAN
jgi:aspartate kinase